MKGLDAVKAAPAGRKPARTREIDARSGRKTDAFG